MLSLLLLSGFVGVSRCLPVVPQATGIVCVAVSDGEVPCALLGSPHTNATLDIERACATWFAHHYARQRHGVQPKKPSKLQQQDDMREVRRGMSAERRAARLSTYPRRAPLMSVPTPARWLTKGLRC